MAARILFSLHHRMTLPPTLCNRPCMATRRSSADRTDVYKHLRRFRAAFGPRLTNLPTVEPHSIEPVAIACLHLLQTCYIAKPSPACTMAVLNSSTGTVLKHWTHSLNARDVGTVRCPRPPGANVAAPCATSQGLLGKKAPHPEFPFPPVPGASHGHGWIQWEPLLLFGCERSVPTFGCR